MKRTPVLLGCLLLSAQMQALTTERIFVSGFDSDAQQNDCAPISITETALEAKFRRRTVLHNVCMPPSSGQNIEVCNTNGCDGMPGCAIPLSPVFSATARLREDGVFVEESVGQLVVPFTTFGANCTLLIDFTARALLYHRYNLQRAGLDGLTVTSAADVLVNMPPYTQQVTGGFLCSAVPTVGLARDIVDNAGFYIDQFETADAPQDAPGSTVCPITR